MTGTPRRIGIVCYPSIGGSGIVATVLGQELARRGHQIHFISYDLPHRLVELGANVSFHHVNVPIYPVFRFPPYTLALATEMVRLAREHQLEIFHVHYAIPHSSSALLARLILCQQDLAHPRVVTTVHGTDSELVGQEPSYKTVVEFSLDMSDAVTAVSRHLKEFTEESFDIDRPIEVIYNPIDTGIFKPAPASSDQSELVVVHLSNFRPVKRVVDTIKAFDLISRRVRCRMVMAGEGPDLPRARDAACQLGLADRIEFPGQVARPEELLASAGLLLSTSEHESFGMGIAEAMACETPVVAYATGGVPEVVEDGVTGMLTPNGDICTLADRAIRILTDERLRRQMGRQGRERICQLFSSHLIAAQYEELYERLMAQEPPVQDCLRRRRRS